MKAYILGATLFLAAVLCVGLVRADYGYENGVYRPTAKEYTLFVPKYVFQWLPALRKEEEVAVGAAPAGQPASQVVYHPAAPAQPKDDWPSAPGESVGRSPNAILLARCASCHGPSGQETRLLDASGNLAPGADWSEMARRMETRSMPPKAKGDQAKAVTVEELAILKQHFGGR